MIGSFLTALPGGRRTRVLRTWHVQAGPKQIEAVRAALGGTEQEGGLTLPPGTTIPIVIEAVEFNGRYAVLRFQLDQVPAAGSFELWSSSDSIVQATPGPAVLTLELVAYVDCDGDASEYVRPEVQAA